MKKFIFLTLVILFLTACSSQGQNEELPADTAKDNLPLPSLQLTAKTEKAIYSSYEKINLMISLQGNQNMQDVFIEAKGISSRLDKHYFVQNQSVSLLKNSTKEINFSQTLPSCNSCSGLTPGNYSITVFASYQGKTLASEKINLTIKQ